MIIGKSHAYIQQVLHCQIRKTTKYMTFIYLTQLRKKSSKQIGLFKFEDKNINFKEKIPNSLEFDELIPDNIYNWEKKEKNPILKNIRFSWKL